MPLIRTAKIDRPIRGAGDRQARVEIQQLTTPASDTGYPVETWVTLRSTVYMYRATVRADERHWAAQDSASEETQWQMPYSADMDPEIVDVPKRRRLVYRGRVYDVRAATIVGPNVAIDLTTLAKVG